MRLHFIVVNYNSGAWLSRAVASIIKHASVHEWQATVVDNASSDDSMEAAQSMNSDSRIQWVFNKDNIGFAAANNQVMRVAQPDYFMLMNPDCLLKEGSVDRVVSALEKFNDWGMASCRILNEDGSLQATCRRRFPTPLSGLSRMLRLDKFFPENPLLQNFDYGDSIDENSGPHTVEAISGAFMVVKHKAIQQVGLLDEGYFMHCEDLDWCKRFQQLSWKVGFVPAAAIEHAKGVSSKSRPIRVLWTLHRGMNRFFDKFYRDAYTWPVRVLVKLGIVVSFILRASLSFARSLRG